MSTVSFTRRAGVAAMLAVAAVTASAATASASPVGGSAGQPFYEVWEPGQARPHSGGVVVPRPDAQGVAVAGPNAVGPLPDGVPQDIRPVVVPGHGDPR